MKFAEWAAPIVSVTKGDGAVWICGDNKLTVNRVAKVETYPLPRIEDLFASLAGGLVFSKLDLTHAYQQLELEESSRKYVTINTNYVSFRISNVAHNNQDLITRRRDAGTW